MSINNLVKTEHRDDKVKSKFRKIIEHASNQHERLSHEWWVVIAVSIRDAPLNDIEKQAFKNFLNALRNLCQKESLVAEFVKNPESFLEELEV